MYVELEEWSYRESMSNAAYDKCNEENPSFTIGDKTCEVESRENRMASHMEEIYGFFTVISLVSLLISSALLYRSTLYKGDPIVDDYDDDYWMICKYYFREEPMRLFWSKG